MGDAYALVFDPAGTVEDGVIFHGNPSSFEIEARRWHLFQGNKLKCPVLLETKAVPNAPGGIRSIQQRRPSGYSNRDKVDCEAT